LSSSVISGNRAMAQIKVENLRKSFDQFTAVQGSNFTIEDGSFFAMLGPSGCGKTTTLRMIAGLELPTGGRVLLDGEDVTFRRAAARDIAFVFQLFALYPHMNVAENIGFPLKCQGMAWREIRGRVTETARLLRIEHLLSSKTSKLSGGDRQRVALGRAMVRRPKAFLMDEPLGALDAEFRHLMCGELRDLHDRINATTIYVTHDQLEAMSMADTIAVMNGGRVEQIGSPQEIYDHPASMFVADFIGSPPMNFLNFHDRLRAGDRVVNFHEARIAVPEIREAHAEGPLVLGVRPEHIRFSDSAPVKGRVFGAEYLGTTQIVTVDTAYGRVAARLPSNLSAKIGDTVGLSFRSERLALFDARSGSAIATASLGVVGHG
jgi:multiple sugar transport system ATP-binding protein